MSLKTLKTIQKLIEGEGYTTCLELESPETPRNRLLLFIEEGAQGKENILAVTAQKQPISLKATLSPPEETLFRIEWESKLPFLIKEGAAADTASLLHLINRNCELPGFEMDEVEDLIFYRYVHLTSKESIDKHLLLALVGTIMLLLKLFNEAIKKIASGHVSLNELLEEVIKISKQSPL